MASWKTYFPPPKTWVGIALISGVSAVVFAAALPRVAAAIAARVPKVG